MKAREIMTSNPRSCRSSDSIQDTARMMRDYDCGSLPVVDDGQKLIGIITDRDLAIRGIAEGKSANTAVSDLMTSDPFSSGVDTDVAEIGRSMAERQIRRVPIVDADGQLVGIIAQADIAIAAQSKGDVTDRDVAAVVEGISAPAQTNNPKIRKTE